MHWENPLFLIPIITGPIYMMMGWILLKKPPKEINSLYGYRTGSSMVSQDRWDFAQLFSAREFLKWGSFLTLSAGLGLVVALPEWLGLILALLVMLLFTVIPVVRTERAIKAKFGNQKNLPNGH